MSKVMEMLEGVEVEWKALGEFAELKRGKTITAKDKTDGNIPVISGGKKPAYYNSEYNREGETITVAGSGAYAGYIMFWNIPIFVSDAFSVKPDLAFLNTKYVYHFLLENQSWIHNLQKGSGVPHVYPKDLATLQIPIPPLHIQAEIVRVLDNFTELTARKKQYSHYREQLLTFEEGQAEWKTLGEVTLSTSNIRWRDTDRTYRYIDLTSVSRENNSITETSEITAKSAPSRAQKLVAKDDVIFATTRPAQQRLSLIDDEYSGEVASTGYCVLRAKTDEVSPKWIYYYISSNEFKNYVEENQSGSAYPAISDAKVKEFKLPIPPLVEQARIVAILDKFDALANSISEGLPREIELRQKQYEYYRDLLLSFPKPEEVAA